MNVYIRTCCIYVIIITKEKEIINLRVGGIEGMRRRVTERSWKEGKK